MYLYNFNSQLTQDARIEIARGIEEWIRGNQHQFLSDNVQNAFLVIRNHIGFLLNTYAVESAMKTGDYPRFGEGLEEQFGILQNYLHTINHELYGRNYRQK